MSKKTNRPQATDPVAPHIVSLIDNLNEVLNLTRFHQQLTGRGRGRRYHVEVLNKGAIVLLVACWEAFIEDLASHSFEQILNNAADHTIFPPRVLSLATSDIRKADDGRAVWRLAGTGWKSVLQNHKNSVLAELVGKVNTPRPSQVDNMFLQLCGTKISPQWKWQGMSASKARQTLEELVTRRGDIAHRVKTSKHVYKKNVIAATKFIGRLAAKSSNFMRKYIHRRTKIFPWHEMNVTFSM